MMVSELARILQRATSEQLAGVLNATRRQGGKVAPEQHPAPLDQRPEAE